MPDLFQIRTDFQEDFIKGRTFCRIRVDLPSRDIKCIGIIIDKDEPVEVTLKTLATCLHTLAESIWSGCSFRDILTEVVKDNIYLNGCR